MLTSSPGQPRHQTEPNFMVASTTGALVMLTNLQVSLDISQQLQASLKKRTSAQLTSSPGQPPEQEH
jgi:hypothetical protein